VASIEKRNLALPPTSAVQTTHSAGCSTK